MLTVHLIQKMSLTWYLFYFYFFQLTFCRVMVAVSITKAVFVLTITVLSIIAWSWCSCYFDSVVYCDLFNLLNQKKHVVTWVPKLILSTWPKCTIVCMKSAAFVANLSVFISGNALIKSLFCAVFIIIPCFVTVGYLIVIVSSLSSMSKNTFKMC